MKKFMLLALGLAGLHTASAASICVTATLASYEALGAAGCTIGGDTFASFTTIAGLSMAAPISPSLVTITPGGGTTNPSLTFSFAQTSTNSQIKEAIFDYTITGAKFLTDVATLSGSSETGNGAVTGIQNFCANGHFTGADGVSGCSGTMTGSLNTIDGVLNTDNVTFASATLLTIVDDFTLDGGGTGSATGGVFKDQFTATPAITATPEPGVFLLTATGLFLAFVRKPRIANRFMNRNRSNTNA